MAFNSLLLGGVGLAAKSKQMEQHETKEEKQRTEQQNKALHVLFTLLANTLNDAGLDMRKVLKPTVDIPWTTQTVKDQLWRPVQQAMLGKESTTELSTTDIDKVFDVINRHLGEKFGIHEDFPSVETIMYKQLGYAPYTPKPKKKN